MARKQYRLQQSLLQGVVDRAYGGRTASWSPWRTVKGFDTLEAAEAALVRCAARAGLTRFRVMYGSKLATWKVAN